MSRRVLILSHLLPPWFMGGTPRLLRWCEALPSNGWEVSLAGFTDYPIAQQLDAIPGGIEHFGLPFDERRGLLGKVARRLSQRNNDAWPDSFAPKVGALGELIATSKIKADLVMVSVPSFSLLDRDFLKGLKKSMNAPVVLDLRDAFSANTAFAKDPAKINAARKLQHQAAEVVDGVATVSRAFTRKLDEWFPKVREKAMVPNAFTRSKHLPHRRKEAWPNKQEGVLRLTFVGHAYGTRAPAYLLPGVGLAIAKEPKLAEVLRLEVIGNWQDDAIGDWSEWPQMLELREAIPYADIPKTLGTSDVLLVVIGDDPMIEGVPGAKVIEYLGARRPILCLSRGAASNIVMRSETGLVANPASPEQVCDALLHLYECWDRNEAFVMNDEAKTDRWEIENVAKELTSFFERVLGNSGASPQA